MIGYGLSGLALTFFLYICFDEAQSCDSQEAFVLWLKAVLLELAFMALVFAAGAFVAVHK